MLDTRMWLGSFAVIAVVLGALPAGGEPAASRSPNGTASPVESPADVTCATDAPREAAALVVRGDVPYEEIVWPWEDDPVWLERRATLLRNPLGLHRRRTERDRLTAIARGVDASLYRTLTDSQLREVLPDFPEIRSLWLEVNDLSDAGLESTPCSCKKRALDWEKTL